MDKDEVAKRDGKARRTNNVAETHTKLDPRYEVVIFSDSEITDTGRLNVGELRPRGSLHKALPRFLFRWDERENFLNIDPENASKRKTKEFRRGTDSYHGHKPIKMSSNSRKFEVDIVWGGHKIYQGQVGFSLHRDVLACTSIGTVVKASYSVGEASKLSKLFQQQISYLLSKVEVLGKKLGHWVVLSLNYMRKRKPKRESR